MTPLIATKGTPSHKLVGRVWALLMVAVAVSSFWIFEIRGGAGPSAIHLLSVWTLVSLAKHRGFMIGTFIGLEAAGAFALAPGRALYRLFFFA
jgi:uncharacterized membrane protein